MLHPEYITREECNAVMDEVRKDIVNVAGTLVLSTLERAEKLLKYMAENQKYILPDKLKTIKQRAIHIAQIAEEINLSEEDK